ncbi:MAG: glutamate-cysteine ligase family protein [Sandaracinaceae bacterium]
MQPNPYGLLEAIGIELEYMVVDRSTLNVEPIVDRLMHDLSGEYATELEMGPIAWSNELALHVLELKTNGPVPTLEGLDELFLQNVREANRQLVEHDTMLLPTAMHPWMDPHREMRLWPHEHNAVYEAFDSIFNCRGHGWANLQSMHINLSFGTIEEFGRLHAAIRLLLPILPALAASSPLKDGSATGTMDTRLQVYRHNADRIPSIAGRVIPEPVFTRRDYEAKILHPIYRDLETHDPTGILRHEWVNARGAIARFDRGAIEIRVLDVQEHPAADLAIAQLAIAAIRRLTEEVDVELAAQEAFSVDRLVPIFDACVRAGERGLVRDADYLSCFGLDDDDVHADELWLHIAEATKVFEGPFAEPLSVILEHGCLAKRIVRSLPRTAKKRDLQRLYRQLAHCLDRGHSFVGF